MNTSMVTNMNLLTDDYSERVDVTLYKQIIDSLMYLTNTRPNICFVVNTLSQSMVEPIHVHLVATKHVMRYLKGTLDCGLGYTCDNEFLLCGYTDSNWARSVEDIKNTSGCCFSMGSGVISSLSRKQTSGALSTTEDTYM